MILPLFAIGAALLGAALASFVVGRRPRGWSDGGLSGVAGQLIDGMHDGLAVQDSEGRLVAWNHAACQITGWDHCRRRAGARAPHDEGLVRLGRAMVHVRRFQVREEGVDHRVTLFSDARDELHLQAAFRDAWRQATINLAVLEASTDGIALVDDVGRALMTNRRMRELASELLGDRNAVGLERVVAGRLTDPQGWLQRPAAARRRSRDRAVRRLLAGRRLALVLALRRAGARSAGRVDRAPGDAARDDRRAGGRARQVRADVDGVARAAYAAGLDLRLRRAAREPPAGGPAPPVRGDHPSPGRPPGGADRRLPRPPAPGAGHRDLGERAGRHRRAGWPSRPSCSAPRARATGSTCGCPTAPSGRWATATGSRR